MNVQYATKVLPSTLNVRDTKPNTPEKSHTPVIYATKHTLEKINWMFTN